MSESGEFESHQRFFDFSGVNTMPLEEYWGMSEDPIVCPPEFAQEGLDAFHLAREYTTTLKHRAGCFLWGTVSQMFRMLLAYRKHRFPSKYFAH